MDKTDVSCSLCGDVYNKSDRSPRTLPCGHTFCYKCLSELFTHRVIRCPEDLTALTTRVASDLPINFSLLHLAMKFPIPCEEHGKALEYFCLDCKKRVCVECGLIGTHRDHLIRADEDLKKEFDMRIQVLCELVEMMKDSREATVLELEQANLQEIYQTYTDRKTEAQAKLTAGFDHLRAQLAVAESEAQSILFNHYEHIDNLFQTVEAAPSSMEQHLNQLKSCISTFVEQIDAFENPFELFENIDAETERLLPLGETVLNSLDNVRSVPSELKRYVDNLVIEIRNVDFSRVFEIGVMLDTCDKGEKQEKSTTEMQNPAPAPAPLDEVQFSALLQEISNETVLEADFSPAGAIGDKAIVLAPILLCNQSLLRLKFSGNHLSQTSLGAIFTAIQGNSSLQRVEITHNIVESQAIDSLLEAMESNTVLQEVNLQSCTISAEDVSRLRQTGRVLCS